MNEYFQDKSPDEFTFAAVRGGDTDLQQFAEMLRQLIRRELLCVLLGVLQKSTQSHHSLLRLVKALSLSFVEDIKVTDGGAGRKQKNNVFIFLP